MKLVIDSKIPFMHGYAELLGDVTYKAGTEIGPDDVRDADALIVRTRTHCDRMLLEGSKVQFIATATIGYDHLDTAWLKEAGIAWTNCPGCNARSVAQYIEAVLLQLAAHGCWRAGGELLPATARVTRGELDRTVFGGLTLGIVGVGHVGTQVLLMAERLGFKEVLLCDPLRAAREGASGPDFVGLDEVAERADVVTFHTPLTREPQPYPTFHLAGREFFGKLRKGAVVINSSRGEVVDTAALKAAMEAGRVRTAVIDTWEHEPGIDRELLDMVFVGTPHIAGYSADGKANGTRMSLEAVAGHFGLDASAFEAVSAPELPEGFAYYPEGVGYLLAPELRLYDPVRDSVALKLCPDDFERLRGNYPLRREGSC